MPRKASTWHTPIPPLYATPSTHSASKTSDRHHGADASNAVGPNDCIVSITLVVLAPGFSHRYLCRPMGVACGYCGGQHGEISVTAVSRFMNGRRGLNGSLSAAVTSVVRWRTNFLGWQALADRDKAVFCACPLHDAIQFSVHR